MSQFKTLVILSASLLIQVACTSQDEGGGEEAPQPLAVEKVIFCESFAGGIHSQVIATEDHFAASFEDFQYHSLPSWSYVKPATQCSIDNLIIDCDLTSSPGEGMMSSLAGDLVIFESTNSSHQISFSLNECESLNQSLSDLPATATDLLGSCGDSPNGCSITDNVKTEY